RRPEGQAGRALHRRVRARAFYRRRVHHARGADWCVRCDGVHHRQVRPRLAAAARQIDGKLLPHLSAVHTCRAWPHRALGPLFQQLTILGVLLLTSKGASGVTGSGFIVLAATLSSVPTIPVAGLALILGIDRFMSEARALTNLIGNGVATIVVSKWERELDHA